MSCLLIDTFLKTTVLCLEVVFTWSHNSMLTLRTKICKCEQNVTLDTICPQALTKNFPRSFSLAKEREIFC